MWVIVCMCVHACKFVHKVMGVCVCVYPDACMYPHMCMLVPARACAEAAVERGDLPVSVSATAW